MFEIVDIIKCTKKYNNLFKPNRSIIISTRNELNKKIYILVNNFFPRFYSNIKIEHFGILEIEEGFLHYITEDPLYRIYLKDTTFTDKVREKIIKNLGSTYESDVIFEIVFKTTKKIQKYIQIKDLDKKIEFKIDNCNFILTNHEDIIPGDKI